MNDLGSCAEEALKEEMMSNGLTLPFSGNVDTDGIVFEIIQGLWPENGQGGIAIKGSSFGRAGDGSPGVGVYGLSDIGSGVHGESYDGDGVSGSGDDGTGVHGLSQNADGVLGESRSNAHAGVSAINDSGGFGVWARGRVGGHFEGDVEINGVLKAEGNAGVAGWFTGNVKIDGILSKGGGGFVIDHPLAPETKLLHHSFVESPDMKNIYDGVIVLDKNGEAWVVLPEWFAALNQDFRYQLTCVGGFASVYIADEVRDNRFKIGGGKPGLKVSWQITGIRHDPFAEKNRIPVEEEKSIDERGTYLHPAAYNQPASRGRSPSQRAAARAKTAATAQ
jgi:hypothetical protein